MTATTVLIFTCGVAVGACLTFILLAVIKQQRTKRYDDSAETTEAAQRQLAEWAKNNPDIVARWNEQDRLTNARRFVTLGDHEPTELDQ